MMLDRRCFLAGTLALAIPAAALARTSPKTLVVYKSPSCGCCSAWVEHLRKAGFAVQATNIADVTPIARKLGVPDDMRSCHTASVGGYFIEGHVPAADIRRLLKERPAALGIAVPGMPLGSPGMEQGGRSEPYATVILGKDGRRRRFASHGG